MAKAVDTHLLALEKIVDIYSRHVDNSDFISVEFLDYYWKEAAKEMAQVADDAVRYGVVFGAINDG